jgi:hypothetical protein
MSSIVVLVMIMLKNDDWRLDRLLRLRSTHYTASTNRNTIVTARPTGIYEP